MVHTLLQANGTPGLQMLESNVMVQLLPGAGTPGRGRGGRPELSHQVTVLADPPFRGKEDNTK